MPSSNNQGFMIGLQPVFSVTGTVYINGGTAIPALSSVTDTYTFTGALTTDINYGISPRASSTVIPNGLIPPGLQLSASSVTATNTLSVTWTNTTGIPITPPASATWTYIVQNEFMR